MKQPKPYARVTTWQFAIGVSLFVAGFVTYNRFHRASELFLTIVGGMLLVVASVVMGVVHALKHLDQSGSEDRPEDKQ